VKVPCVHVLQGQPANHVANDRMRPLGPDGLLYLAAAVSDFFVSLVLSPDGNLHR
jgi:hypothetical protein